ncbi:MAG TPA: hypothetical protein VLJ79_12615, partial [Candidatus Binatia bacterium]|nr:hypothetical protein [Candidatus Binatia bacterium]
RAQGTNEGSVSSTHCVSPLLLQTARDTKLLPVVQLRSGVIVLMGDPELALFCKVACRYVEGSGELTPVVEIVPDLPPFIAVIDDEEFAAGRTGFRFRNIFLLFHRLTFAGSHS